MGGHKKGTLKPGIATRHKYHVVVDYGMTIEQMAEAGRYYSKDECINSENFLPVVGEGMVNTKLELVHLNRRVRTSGAEACLEANGLRSATLAELLAFGAKYRNVHMDFPVIALGSSWVDQHGKRYVLCLDFFGLKRNLDIELRSLVWGRHCRFLAVCS